MNEIVSLKATKRKRMFRWSLISAGAIALFWLIFYLKNGYMPVASEIPGWPIAYVPGVPRWWDVLLGPLWAIPLAYLSISSTRKPFKDDEVYTIFKIVILAAIFGFTYSLVASYLNSLSYGFATSIISVFALCLAVVSIISLIVSFVFDFTTGFLVGVMTVLLTVLAVSCAYGIAGSVLAVFLTGLAVGIVFGFDYNLKYGLTASLAYGLTASLAYGLTHGLSVGLATGLLMSICYGWIFICLFDLLIKIRKVFKHVASWLLVEEG